MDNVIQATFPQRQGKQVPVYENKCQVVGYITPDASHGKLVSVYFDERYVVLWDKKITFVIHDGKHNKGSTTTCLWAKTYGAAKVYARQFLGKYKETAD